METKETKEFWRTSEFWVMLLTQLVALVSQLAGSLPPKYGIPAMAAVSAFYQISRGIAKSGNPVVTVPLVVPAVTAPLPPHPAVHESLPHDYDVSR
jgi:hypothetical protein